MSTLGKIRRAALAGGAGIAALAAVNAALERSRTKISRARRQKTRHEIALGGDAYVFHWKNEQVRYQAAGDKRSPALVFIHGIGVGSSSSTWRHNFTQLARDFRVYAPDLLGFGASAKPPTAPYSAELYIELLGDFIAQVVVNESGNNPGARVVANGLGAAFAVHVADKNPSLVDSLILVAPTDAGESRPGVTGAAFYGLMHSPVLGASFYNAMASERSLRDHARKSLFYEKRIVTDALIARYYESSHQPGAQYALAAFFSGYLNTDMRAAFARLDQPITLVWGREDTLNPTPQGKALLKLNPRATLEIFDRARALPHEEHPEQFNQLVRRHLGARSVAA